MNRNTKILSREWPYIILAWVLLLYFYYFLTFRGTSDFLEEGIITDYIRSWPAHLELIMGGVFFGLLFSVVNSITDKYSLRRRSFGYIILIKSVLYLVSWSITMLCVYTVYSFFEIIPKSTLDQLFVLPPLYVVSLLTYWVFVIVLLNFILQVSWKFGPGNLSKLIMGKYQNPKEENRIFMFLDLQGSTAIAEKLGHKTYSRLLRDCYHDLTDIVIRYKADIYQYVGDEVVLSWSVKDGLNDLSCFKTFFDYEGKLQDRSDFYSRQYKTRPEFKGGMDMGHVTVAEIGDIKREIAYHGDVLNTASRIQGRCRDLNRKLLISGNLEKHLTTLNGFAKALVGKTTLRGKTQAVSIYSIELAHN
jgi:adenylate cyclase